jgi:hypothetical protein
MRSSTVRTWVRSRPGFFAACGLALALPAEAVQISCVGANLARDFGFERAAGSPLDSPEWAESSIQHPSPICSMGTCPGAGATAHPLSGTNWVWFVGVGGATPEIASISQVVELPAGVSAWLDYHYFVGAVSAPFTDELRISIDGELLTTRIEPSVAQTNWAWVIRDISAYADGLTHVIKYEYVKGANGNLANFNLDELRVGYGGDAVLLDDSFEEAVGAPLDSPFWTEGSTTFSSPICSFALCGDGNGTAAPASGSKWAWFGGVSGDAPEVSTLAQAVRLPLGLEVALEYKLWVGEVSAPFTDRLEARIDAILIDFVVEPTVAGTSYVERSAPVASFFMDGGIHEVRFSYTKGLNGNRASFNFEEPLLNGVECRAIFLDDFEIRDAANWSAVVP